MMRQTQRNLINKPAKKEFGPIVTAYKQIYIRPFLFIFFIYVLFIIFTFHEGQIPPLLCSEGSIYLVRSKQPLYFLLVVISSTMRDIDKLGDNNAILLVVIILSQPRLTLKQKPTTHDNHH